LERWSWTSVATQAWYASLVMAPLIEIREEVQDQQGVADAAAITS